MKPELAKVGEPWNGAKVSSWPGVAGKQGESNYLAKNDNPFLPDPVNSSSTQDNLVGGRKTHRKGRKTHRKGRKTHRKGRKTHRKGRKTHRKGRNTHRKGRNTHRKGRNTHRKGGKTKQIGGSNHGKTLLPQSLVNLGREAQYNVEGTFSAFTGGPAPVNPDPTVQPIGNV